MKKYVTLVALATIVIFGGNVSADQITIADGRIGSGNTWYSTGAEDQEVEPGMIVNQKWDLEGFFQTGDILSVVGGYDFKNGYSGTASGDIFVSIDGIGGIGGAVANYGYEFVFDLNYKTMTYDLIDLRSGATLANVSEPSNVNAIPTSNPWRYESGGTKIDTNSFTYAINNNYGFLGDNTSTTHYEISGFDLSFLRNYLNIGDSFWVHNTMSCGNDNLMGQGTVPVPEPATMLLFGTGIAGLVGMARRKKIRNNNN